MEKMAELLEKLAVKFGTTVEHLWEVMLRQAPISGAVKLGIDVTLIIFLILVFKFVRRNTTTHKFLEGTWKHKEAEWEGEAACWAWFVVAILGAVTGLITLVSLTDIVAAFLILNIGLLQKFYL